MTNRERLRGTRSSTSSGRPSRFLMGPFPRKGARDSLPVDFPMLTRNRTHRLLQGPAAPVELWRIQKGPRNALTDHSAALEAVEKLTEIYDYLPGWDTGGKDRGALFHILRNQIDSVLDRIGERPQKTGPMPYHPGRGRSDRKTRARRPGARRRCPGIQTRGNRS